MQNQELFSNASLKDMKKGYVYLNETEEYICLICGKRYEEGIIYRDEENFYTAKKYMKLHIENDHVSMFHYLINMNKKYTGLTEIQKEFLTYYKNNYSDKEIAEKMGGSQSTIRNHRFKLREKEKQAKIFLVLMELLKEDKIKEDKIEDLVSVHKAASMVDERYATTEKEKNKIINTYFDETGHLKEYPSKAKRKIIVLSEIMSNFKEGRKYSEKEVNRILKRIYDDYVSIRRALVEYGFMDRKNDCSEYWVKE